MPFACLVVAVLMCGPRLLLIGFALFSNWFSIAYETALWPVLGWFFMPWTTMAYMAAMVNNDHQITGGWLVMVVIAVVFDFAGSISVRVKSD